MVRSNGARTVVVETRYIDLDFRSEYSAFYSRAFAHYPDSTRRLHFFADEIPREDLWCLGPNAEGLNYLGYVVLRPPAIGGMVGRAMLAPPKQIRQDVRTAVRETVHLFGAALTVKAVPFIQQEARLGSCAHAASWMCHYSAFRANLGVARKTIAQFSTAVNPGLGVGRVLPSTGLTLHQISDLLGAFGLPPLYYDIEGLTDSDRPGEWPNKHGGPAGRVARVCCRYLNSALPVLVVLEQSAHPTGPAKGLHAIMVCGYKRDENVSGGVHFIVHDDRRGPYLTVGDMFADVDSRTSTVYKWQQILAPVPEKLWLSGEAAERTGCETLLVAAERAARSGVTDCAEMLQLHEDEELTVRTYATDSSVFKRRIRQNSTDPVVLREYMYARLPRYVWVVEAINRRLRPTGKPVLGEVLFDATSDELNPSILAVRLPGLIAVSRPDDPQWDEYCSADPIASSGQYAS